MIDQDELGFAPLGCFGRDIETAHIDRLAYGGVRYNPEALAMYRPAIQLNV